jgi:hypothetical protein
MNDPQVKDPFNAESRGNAVLWAAALLALGRAVQINDGNYDPSALAWVAAGVALAWMGFFLPPGKAGMALGMCALGLAFQIIQLFQKEPLAGDYHYHAPRGFYWAVLPLMGAAAVGAMGLRGMPRNIGVGLLAAIFFAGGVWLLRTSPPPQIDVYVVTQDACAALKEGRNPYAIDIPDIYAAKPEWDKAFYSPGTVVNGRVQLGYPYMPLSLAVACAGNWLTGDYRMGNLAAVAIAAALLGFARRGFLAAAGAVLLLTTPRGYFVIQFGWAEPTVIVCMALVVFCALRWRAGLPYAMGLMLASKQHMLLAAPALWLIVPKDRRGWFVLKTAAMALCVTLPLVLWNAAAFWHSAIGVQIANPFRYDSLNFAAWWTKLGHAPPPGAISFLLGALAAGIVAWRGKSNVSAFAAGVAVIYLTFFALSKQTFCNYYFLAVGALCCAVAAKPEPEESS